MARDLPNQESAADVVAASPAAASPDDNELLQAHQARLAAIVETSDDAIISKNTRGIVMSWNAGAERIFGWTAAEMLGSPIFRIVPEELRDEEHRILSMVRGGQRIDHFETARLRKDGSRVAVSITVSPIKDAQGRIVGASKIARDIGAQRDSAMLAAIVQSSDDAIVSKDLDGRVTSWNQAAERLYGWSSKEIVGQPIFLVIPAELRSEEEDILARVRRGERVEHFETTRLHKDGSPRDVSITVSPVLDGNGRIIGASKIARDISAQRAAQREKDRFLAILAHELRNPLAPIRNAVQLLGQPNVGPDGRTRALQIAERQIGHMAQLLDDLLDVARLNTGRVELKLEDLAVRPVIEHAVDAARPTLDRRSHVLTVTHPEEALWIHADQVRILQIVANLLTNAAKYTDAGGRVELDYRRIGKEVAIQVCDNGIGFSPHMRAKLFQLFAQASEATSRADGGLGIGLALVREFTERQGGRVEAESEGLGKGSCFRIWLPLVPVPGDAAAA